MLGMIIVLYLLGCAVTGFMGRRTTFGFVGHFFLSVLVTPIGDFLIQVVGRPNREIRRKMEELD